MWPCLGGKKKTFTKEAPTYLRTEASIKQNAWLLDMCWHVANEGQLSRCAPSSAEDNRQRDTWQRTPRKGQGSFWERWMHRTAGLRRNTTRRSGLWTKMLGTIWRVQAQEQNSDGFFSPSDESDMSEDWSQQVERNWMVWKQPDCLTRWKRRRNLKQDRENVL